MVDSPVFAEAYSFECGDGWAELIYRLSEDISRHAVVAGLNIIVTQVKEKYGSLRFYVDGEDDKISALIEDAEEESKTICEVCGSPGKLITSGWCSTRCVACRET